MEKLILIGAGGYAKSVVDSIDYFNYELEGFIDEFTTETEHLGKPVIAKHLDEIEHKEKYVYFVCIGNNMRRKAWYDRLKENNLRMINVVDRTAIVSPKAVLGTGCFIGKMAVINNTALVGNDCIINTRASIEHGCRVADHVNLSTSSVINGDVEVGEGSFIGSGSITIGQKKIGRWSTVGAGAVVIRDVGDNVTVAGVPARIIREGAMLG